MLFEPKFNLLEVLFIIATITGALGSIMLAMERTHAREIGELRTEIRMQRKLIGDMQERIWPHETHGTTANTTIHTGGGPYMADNTAGRDINVAQSK